jgi:hypothetical protein
MGEDWRVSLTLHDWSSRGWKRAASQLDRSLRARLSGDIRVSSSGAWIFMWSRTMDAALEAERVARDVLAEQGVGADCWLEHWNPVVGEWRDAAFFNAADVDAAWARRQDEDRSNSAATGFAAWNVRVELHSRHDLVVLAERLRSGGWPVVRRRRYLLAGANCEADLGCLVPQIQAATSAGTNISVRRWTPPPWSWAVGPPVPPAGC